ncbi:amidohydrolase family protein [Thermosipho sp. (in: thermotogales)]|jgi:dihydropyrimidinase|uniref:amidohydrolase family protein n=1 Tax=Thermosipho sp. (in: thermotogales) TaxID=1968895 RepID=UPI00257DFDE4|nr:amidohydrolase family protein [Thermosipho sp. (in: thermotogales)]MBZ4649903.1 putative D-hydantoinase [Thermosipho sp. (in: thermotogales)]
MFDLGILNGKLYLDGNFVNANLYIKSGKIIDISTSFQKCKEEIDATGKVVLPGFIDPHVHFELNLGKYTSVDDFESGSISALFGGVTTIIDFLDPISKVEELDIFFKKRLAAANKSLVDYSFHTTLGNFEGDLNILLSKIREYGINSIKIFTAYSSSNRRTNDRLMFELFKKAKNHKIPILIHAENEDMITENVPINLHSKARPEISEISEIIKIAEFLYQTNGTAYIVHTTCGSSIEEVKNRFNDILNKNIFFESCPHYFYFDNSVYDSKKGYLFTMTPPLRSKKEKQKLKNNIDNIFSIGTDHCSFNSKDKRKRKTGNIPMGIGGIEHSFVLMYSIFHENIIDKFTINPARFFGLYPRKGTLLPGADADIVIFNPKYNGKISMSHTKADYDLYLGTHISGKIEKVIKDGLLVINQNQLVKKVKGKFLRR